MPLKHIWAGQSLIDPNNQIYNNAELFVKEGYHTGSTYEYIDIGRVYVDSFTHDAGPINDTISISASSELKKLSKWRSLQNYNYESAHIHFDSFTGTVYSDRWQADSSNFYQGGSQLIGTSTAIFPLIAYSSKTNMKNVFFEFKHQSSVVNLGGAVRGLIRLSNMAGLDGVSYFLATNFLYGTTVVSLGYKVDATGFSSLILSTPQTFSANTDYWGRIIGYEDKVYSFYSKEGTSWVLVGGSWASIAGTEIENMKGLVALTHNRPGTTKFDDVKIFSYDNIYTSDYIIKDTLFKSGINNTYVDSQFELINTPLSTGLTELSGSWTGGRATGQSHANVWNTKFTGLSFVDFRFDVEVAPGISSRAGIFVGQSGNQFNGFWFTGLSNNAGMTYILTQAAAHEVLMPGGSRTTNYIPIVQEYPYTRKENVTFNIPHKMSIIKDRDKLYFLINDEMVFGYQGGSGISIDGYNTVGMMLYSQQSFTNTAFFRNMRISKLSRVIPSMEVQAGTSGDNIINRLDEIDPFELNMQGVTAHVLQKSDQDTPIRTYDLGNSHTAWDVKTAKNDNAPNHIIVYGDKVHGEAWDIENYESTGQERLEQITEESLDTSFACSDLAAKILAQKKTEAFSMSYENKAQLDLEKHDVLTIIDQTTGVSEALRINNITKNYNPDSADFSSTITLGKL